MNSAVEMLSISRVAREAGVRPSAIRYYESIGLLPPAPRLGGWRQFDTSAIDYVRVIRSARDMGFSLDEIRLLLHGYPQDTAPTERWATMANKKLPELDNLIRRASARKRLLEAGLACGCKRIEDCFLDDCSATTPSSQQAAL